jgi:CHAD domain-containing protein
VAVRRSRSVLRELRRAFPPAALAEQRDALRWIQEVTGPTRDLDVQLLDEPGFLAPTAGGHDALAPVRELLARQRADAFRLLRRRLRSDTYARRWAAYRSFLATVPTSAEAPGAAEDPTGGDGADGEAADERPDAARPIAQVAGRRIRRVYARMLDMGGAIDDTSPPEALHELRKRGKEQRYLLELFGGLWPSDTVRPMVRRLKDLQDVLGAHQDHEVQAAQLRSLAGELAGVDGGPEALLALGVVVDRLHQAQRASRADFAERFAAFAAADQQRLVSDTFRWPR